MKRIALAISFVALTSCSDGDVLQQSHGEIQAQPPRLNFGPIPEGRTESQSVVITNAGSVGIIVTATISGADFALPAVTLALSPHQIGSLEVAFTPRGAGADSGILYLSADDPEVARVEVELRGGPIEPVLAVMPNPVTFGPSTTTTVTRTVTITNSGSAHLHLSEVEIDATANPDFRFTAAIVLPPLIPPGAAFTADVRYVRSLRSEPGLLRVRSDGGDLDVRLVPDPRAAECTSGASERCGATTTDVGECEQGMRRCVDGAWSPCMGERASTSESCDGRDNDCDGMTDEDIAQTCVVNGCAGSRVCVPGGTGMFTECRPSNVSNEICNGLDDDCDGTPDDGLGTLTCGVGACTATVAACSGGRMGVCTPRAPGREICNGLDDDCDGTPDDGLLPLLGPADGAQVTERRPELTWTSTPGATYRVHLSTAMNMMPELAGYPALATSPFTPPNPLADGLTYYWRVEGRTAGGCTFSSPVRSFRVGSCTYSFALTSPANGAMVANGTPSLTWGMARGSTCTVELSDAGGTPVAGYPRSNATSPHLVASTLPAGTYRWAVQCMEAVTECSARAGENTFVVPGPCSVGTPVLTHPDDGAQWLGGPRLGWQTVAGATGYTVEVDTAPAFSGATRRTTSQLNLHTIADLALPMTPGTTYYWRVTAGNMGCNGSPSASRSFTVAMIYDRASCASPSQSGTSSLLGGGFLGSSYAGQLDFVTSGALAGKIIVPVSDSDGLINVQSNVRCFESATLAGCATGPGATFGADITMGINANVPGATVDPATGTIYVSASDGFTRRMYRYSSAGMALGPVTITGFHGGLTWDAAGSQIFSQLNGSTTMSSLAPAGTTNWQASTSATVNTDVEILAARGLVLQSVQGGAVDVFPYVGPAGPAPVRAFSIPSAPPAFGFTDPVGLAGPLGPPGNPRFVAVADFASPGSITFLHVGAGAADSYATYRVTDPSLRFTIGMDHDPVSGQLFAVTHPAGGSLKFTSFSLLRFCPRTN